MLAERMTPQRWLLVPQGSQRIHAVIEWPDTSGLGIRAYGSEWLMFDGQGRLLRFDTRSGLCKGTTLR